MALYFRTSAFLRNLPALAAGVVLLGVSVLTASADVNDAATTTPIKHVIVIIGENRTFDQVFATYEPVNKGETVLNLLSEGIVKPDGSPGPNYGKALQYRGSDTTTYQLAPLKAPYATLPPALVGGPTTPYVCQALGIAAGTSCDTPANEAAAAKLENGLPEEYLKSLLTGGTGQTAGTPIGASRTTAATPATFGLVRSRSRRRTIPTTPMTQARCIASFRCGRNSTATPLRPPRKTRPAASPICSLGSKQRSARATTARRNRRISPTRRRAKAQPRWVSTMSMHGDAPYLKYLADAYTMSDNYHQAVMGGTGANHIMLGAGDRDMVQRRRWRSRDPARLRRQPRQSRNAGGRKSELSHRNREP